MEPERSASPAPEPSARRTVGQRAATSRRKLWEVPDRYMCSLVGTCLSVKEIRKVALRDDLCGPEIGDYDLHGLIVTKCRTRSRTSRSLHKVLERRYQAAVRRFSKAEGPDDIMRLWSEGVEKGDVPGPLWALLTHPRSSLTALELAFGDVHMLSHALGATRRIDQKDYDKLGASLEQERNHTAQLRRALKERDDALEAADARAALHETELQKLHARLADDRTRMDLQRDVASLTENVEELRTRLDQRLAELEDAQRNTRRLEAQQEQLHEELRALELERDAALDEAKAAEAHLLSVLDTSDEASPLTTGGQDLHGARVLYVGGRTNLVPHYRAVVEGQGGSFVHHDGGLEQSCAQLESLIGGAQLVVCPTDAISHSSWLRVKRACRHRTHAFLPVRTSSMASLLSAIQRGVLQTDQAAAE